MGEPKQASERCILFGYLDTLNIHVLDTVQIVASWAHKAAAFCCTLRSSIIICLYVNCRYARQHKEKLMFVSKFCDVLYQQFVHMMLSILFVGSVCLLRSGCVHCYVQIYSCSLLLHIWLLSHTRDSTVPILAEWAIWVNPLTSMLASSPGPSQILSRCCGEKSGEGLGSKLRHGPEMVDSVSTNRVHIALLTKSTISSPWKL